jgi:hypothetical protein
MASTPVSKDQFEINKNGITHEPTGANFTPHPGSPHSGNANWANLGNVLPNGADHRPEEVKRMMERLWAEYVEANPSQFTD